MEKLTVIIASLIIMLNTSSALAGRSRKPDIFSAGGIASPGGHSAIFTNPAGFVYLTGFSINLGAGSVNNDFSSPTVEGDLYYGKPGFGLGFGTFGGLHSSDPEFAHYGTGFYFNSLKTAIGVNGISSMSPLGSSNVFNVGVLINPAGRGRVGLTVRDVGGGIAELGAGVAYDIAHGLTILSDATMTKQFTQIAIKPGIEISGAMAALTVSYGLSLNNGNSGDSSGFNSEELTQNLSAGVSFHLGQTLQLKAYYQQLNKYDVSVVIEF